MSSDSSPKLLWNRAGGNQWDGSAQLRGSERVCVVHAVAGFVACLPFSQLACLVARCWSVNLCMGVWACRGCAATQIGARFHKVDSYRLLETGEHQPSLPQRGMWLVPVCTRCQGLAVEPGPCASKPSPLPSSQTVPAVACPHPPNGKEQKKVTAVSLGPPSCPSISEPSVSLLFFSLLRIRVPCVSGFPSVAIDFVFRLRAVLWQKGFCCSAVLPCC